jgi:putative transposase
MLLYHLVCPAKYRRAVFTERVDQELRIICLEISQRFEITFVEIGVDKDHAHFLIQTVPTISPKQIAQIVKSITAREIFERVPEVKKFLWGGAFWTSGYFINTVGKQGNENSIAEYVKNQGRVNEYKQLHRTQLSLF